MKRADVLHLAITVVDIGRNVIHSADDPTNWGEAVAVQPHVVHKVDVQLRGAVDCHLVGVVLRAKGNRAAHI